ncbi:MAG TPA: SPOR domain-containing protein [Bauldia sp.]|nr:SPOR domain-containing protein [Bauldia sp.]
MADRYEPKLSVRPMSERKPAQPPAEDDPLLELTRMISGRSTFDPAPAQKNKTVPAATSAGASQGDSGLAMDLESELMSDLQASFGLIRDGMASPAAAKAAPAPAPAAPAAPPKPAAPSPAATAAEPSPRPAPAAASGQPSAAAPRADRVPPPIPPRSERQNIPVAPPLARADRPVLPNPPASVAPPPAAPSASAPTLGERTSIYRSNNSPTVDLSHLQMRPTAAPAAAPAPPPKGNVPRWGAASAAAEAGRAAAPAAPEAPSKFAPPRAVAAPPPRSEAPEVEVGEEPFELTPEDEFAIEDLSALPEYGDNEVPFPEDELAGLSRRRNGRAIGAIAGVLVIALAGGLAYFMLSDSSSTAPPIIAADPTPTKVIPDQTAEAPVAKDTDRVDALDTSGDTNLVKPDESAVAALPTDTDSKNPISRVLLPAGPGYDAPADGEAAAGDAAADESGQIGPKKVRTVVVRPDGTIVSTEAVAADGSTPPVVTPPPAATPVAAAPAPAAPAADASLPLEPTAAPKETGMDTVLNGKGIPVDTDPLATAAKADTAAAPPSDATPPSGATPPPVAASEPAPAPPTGTVPATDPAEVAAAPPINAVPPTKPVKPPKPVVVAAKPMQLTPAPAAAAAPALPSGAALVQLSSQKSEDAARSTYAGLQRKFAAILGPYKPNIARADLGDRGIYYRVRVGPFSAADAARLCEDLRAAGGECIIAR